MLNVFSKLPPGSKLSLALALSVATGIAASATDPGAAVSKSYETALASAARPLDLAAAATQAPESGSEAYWLGQSYASTVAAKGDASEGALHNAVFSNTFAKGKQIVAGEGDAARTLEIVSVARVEPASTRIDLTGRDSRYLVTCRDVENGATRVLEIELAGPDQSSDAPHAL